MGSIAFFEEGIARVVWHTQQGHSIFLVSGTLEALAQMAATALECELEARGVQLRPRIFATRLKEMRGRWTGEIDGQALYGRSKAQLGKGNRGTGEDGFAAVVRIWEQLIGQALSLRCRPWPRRQSEKATGRVGESEELDGLALASREEDHFSAKQFRISGNPPQRGTSMKDGNIREWRQQSIDSAWTPASALDRPAGALPAAESETLRVSGTLNRTIAEAWAACGAFEWLALGYLGATSALIATFAENLAHPFGLLAAQAIVATIVLWLCLSSSACRNARGNSWAVFFSRLVALLAALVSASFLSILL